MMRLEALQRIQWCDASVALVAAVMALTAGGAGAEPSTAPRRGATTTSCGGCELDGEGPRFFGSTGVQRA